MHIVSDDGNISKLKKKVRDELKEHNINHVTIEIEEVNEKCDFVDCSIDLSSEVCNHHHHH